MARLKLRLFHRLINRYPLIAMVASTVPRVVDYTFNEFQYASAFPVPIRLQLCLFPGRLRRFRAW